MFPYDLDGPETRLVIDWLMRRLTMDQRRTLMFAHPSIYNKLVGGEIMHVHQHNTGECTACHNSDKSRFFRDAAARVQAEDHLRP